MSEFKPKTVSAAVAKRVERDTKAFEALPPWKKRVTMAQDALLWLKAGVLRGESGTYVALADDNPLSSLSDILAYNPELEGAQARDLVLGPCVVCAKGALLVAKAVRANHVTLGELSSYDNDYLSDYFDEEEIDAMEAAFEHRDDPWRQAIEDDTKRLTAILENIVRNRGRFIYDDLPKT